MKDANSKENVDINLRVLASAQRSILSNLMKEIKNEPKYKTIGSGKEERTIINCSFLYLPVLEKLEGLLYSFLMLNKFPEEEELEKLKILLHNIDSQSESMQEHIMDLVVGSSFWFAYCYSVLDMFLDLFIIEEEEDDEGS